MWIVEVTDTFGGEANYCWVHRHVIAERSEASIKPALTRRELVREAKRLEGWTGLRCETNDMGDMIEVRPRRTTMVMFIHWQDSE